VKPATVVWGYAAGADVSARPDLITALRAIAVPRSGII
jgi:hypothetical protein